MRLHLPAFLFGEEPAHFLPLVVLAVLLAGATTVAYELVLHQMLGGVVFYPGPVAFLGVLAAGLAGLRNSGLVVGILLGAAPAFGFNVFHYVLSIGHRSVQWGLVEAALSPMLVIGGVIGVVGFLLGRGLDRLSPELARKSGV
ncbi:MULTISPECIES: hypothetical protein [unclassified Haladaptatus]|uniref:hypothetical protein n=1 Tax=unclassified Haladaptatus TaxID=2622732 RepID=UPI0023E8ECF4|nr:MULTISPECIES: hypothetical protein [unclassified Haladaptatus]